MTADVLLFVGYTACVLLDSYLTAVFFVRGHWILGTIFIALSTQSVRNLWLAKQTH